MTVLGLAACGGSSSDSTAASSNAPSDEALHAVEDSIGTLDAVCSTLVGCYPEIQPTATGCVGPIPGPEMKNRISWRYEPLSAEQRECIRHLPHQAEVAGYFACLEAGYAVALACLMACPESVQTCADDSNAALVRCLNEHEDGYEVVKACQS